MGNGKSCSDRPRLENRYECIHECTQTHKRGISSNAASFHARAPTPSPWEMSIGRGGEAGRGVRVRPMDGMFRDFEGPLRRLWRPKKVAAWRGLRKPPPPPRLWSSGVTAAPLCLSFHHTRGCVPGILCWPERGPRLYIIKMKFTQPSTAVDSRVQGGPCYEKIILSYGASL